MESTEPDINLVKLGFSMMISFIIIIGSLMNTLEKYLPVFIRKSFRYGKFSYNGRDDVKVIEVPKAWFKHFYVFSTAYSTLVLLVTINIYLFGGSVPLGFVQLLDFAVGTSRQATVSAFSTLLAVVLMTAQCYRRLYETHCISVFASHSRMNLSHYVVGMAHYAGVFGAIMAEGPAFANASGAAAKFSISSIRILDLVGFTLFIWAWIHQYISAIILANLRKDHTGSVVTHEYKIPQGDWFNLVSSPHSLSEILIYVALTLILWGNSTWYFVLTWVLTNQVQTSLMTHRWYQQTFKDYPGHRKAILPFLY